MSDWQTIPFEDACARLGRNDKGLTMLNLGFRGLRDAEVQKLALILQKNTVLKQLSLHNNNDVGDNGVRDLAVMLRTNTTLEVLKLSNLKCGKDAAIALADALRTNTALKALSVNGNSLGDGGVAALGSMLQTNRTLETLDIRDCRIGPIGMRALADSLRSNTTLKTLHVDGNNGALDGVQAIADSLRANASLTELRWDKGQDVATDAAIVEYLQLNKSKCAAGQTPKQHSTASPLSAAKSFSSSPPSNATSVTRSASMQVPKSDTARPLFPLQYSPSQQSKDLARTPPASVSSSGLERGASQSAVILRSQSLAACPTLRLPRGAKYHAFLTHDWGTDQHGRKNHTTVSRINAGLKKRGLVTWFDEDRMEDDIHKKMAEGITDSAVVVCFITKCYMDKVNGHVATDNCRLEFAFASRQKGRVKNDPCTHGEQLHGTSCVDGGGGHASGRTALQSML